MTSDGWEKAPTHGDLVWAGQVAALFGNENFGSALVPGFRRDPAVP